MPLLTITPLKYSDIPAEQTIIAEGQELLESTTSWKQGKTYYKNVVTYKPKQPGDGAPWHCRVSVHGPDEVTFDQLWDGLGRNKAINEQQFIPELEKVTKIVVLSENAEIWTLDYKFSLPVSPRVFTVLQVTHLKNENSPRSGLIVSIPVDLSGQDDLSKLEANAVRARYVSVESLVELEDGKTEWRMAMSADTGGYIPSFIAETMMPNSIAKDVPCFLKWIHNLPK
ncbi:hypothetical protein APHAL10511_000959 [Amanita phalloides]|nr:hypothetical protein APHAL10511_000959 [Amanita phalloides]